MKRTKLLFCLALLFATATTFAQRPEALYVRKGIDRQLKKKTPGIPVVPRAARTMTESCATCQQTTFSTFAPDPFYTSIYGLDSVWTHTYDVLTPDPVYSGGFYNFNSGCITFTHYADVSFGPMTYWDGFTVSKTNAKPFPCELDCNESCNILESQFSSITGGGAGGSSDPYAVAYYGYNDMFFPENHTTLTLASPTSVCGLYVTNNVYAVKSMKCGDGFAYKFGYGDSLMLTIQGFNGGIATGSINYYLADFRTPDSAYIVDEWKWVNTSSLGTVDSLAFSLTTSDVGLYGPNTPMYFCIDDIKLGTDPACGPCAPTDTTHNWFPVEQAKAAVKTAAAKPLLLSIAPNPVAGALNVHAKSGNLLEIYDAAGNKKISKSLGTDKQKIDVSGLRPGVYIVRITEGTRSASAQFIKQ